jgi:hypothetical protein
MRGEPPRRLAAKIGLRTGLVGVLLVWSETWWR